MKRPKITDICATTVAVPLEAPIRHSNGAHWGRFVRTIVEVETDTGVVGLGEMGGGGESAEMAFAGLKSYLLGHDPFELEAGARIAGPDDIGFDPADNRQADDHAIAAAELVGIVDHEAMGRDVRDMEVQVAMIVMLGDHRIIDRMPRSAAQIGYAEICSCRHGRRPSCSVSMSVFNAA